MKKWIPLLLCALLLLGCAAGVSAASGREGVLINLRSMQPRNAVTVKREGDGMRIVFDGTGDPQTMIVINSAAQVACEDYPYLAFVVDMDTESDPGFQLYFGTDKHPGLAGDRVAAQPYLFNGLQLVVVDMSQSPQWEGKFNTLRFDPLDSDADYEMRYVIYAMGLFPTKEAALAFDAEGYTLPDGVQIPGRDAPKPSASPATPRPLYSLDSCTGLTGRDYHYQYIVRAHAVIPAGTEMTLSGWALCEDGYETFLYSVDGGPFAAMPDDKRSARGKDVCRVYPDFDAEKNNYCGFNYAMPETADLTPGIHEVILRGVTYAGESIDFGRILVTVTGNAAVPDYHTSAAVPGDVSGVTSFVGACTVKTESGLSLKGEGSVFLSPVPAGRIDCNEYRYVRLTVSGKGTLALSWTTNFDLYFDGTNTIPVEGTGTIVLDMTDIRGWTGSLRGLAFDFSGDLQVTEITYLKSK